MIALVIAGFIAGNSTVAALVVNISEMESATRAAFQKGLLVSSIMVASLLAPQLARSIVGNLRRGSLSVEGLFVLASIGAMGFSLQSYVRGSGPVYFEVFSILLVIYCLGSWIKHRTQRDIWASLDAWSPHKHQCRVIDHNGNLQLRVVADVRAGDRVQVSPGAMIPVDGLVSDGEAFVRESTITGEPNLRSVTPGDQVYASSVLFDAPLQIEATRSGSDRLIDRVASVVAAAEKLPSRWQTQADRVARIFTPIVATVALLTFIVWFQIIDASDALMIALSVLLVACPCAFGFATPVTIWLTLSRLASRSLVVQRADVIERLASIDTVVFDKTGTLTVVQPELTELIVRPAQPLTRSVILSLAKSVEQHSHHPIASVFLSANEGTYPTLLTETIPAIGVRGQVRLEGRIVVVEVGRLNGLHRPCCDRGFLSQVKATQKANEYAIAIRVDGELVAAAMVQEAAIDTLDEGLEQLRRLGMTVKVFSGDRGQRVQALGISDSQGGMTAEEKAEQVQLLRKTGRKVLFVGDGVNDAAAMKLSTASICVAEGATLAVEASDIVWHGHDLRSIATALTIARRSALHLRRALLFAIAYNSLGILIAAFGWLHPVVAVLLMLGSSLTIVLHAADTGWESCQSDSLIPINRASAQMRPVTTTHRDERLAASPQLIQISKIESS